MANPFEHSWIWLRKESVFELSLRVIVRNELIRTYRGGKKNGLIVYAVSLMLLSLRQISET
jgi:hypothetical protein